MSIKNQKLCSFSKPIIGRWCHCPYTTTMEACTGKLACNSESKFHISCNNLVDTLKDYSSFILGFSKHDTKLTHSQMMKIRCGGIIGMQRVMQLEMDSPPIIPDIITNSETRYGDVGQFPFNEIIQDIKTFCLRKKHH